MAKRGTPPAHLASAAAPMPYGSIRANRPEFWVDEFPWIFDWGSFDGPAVMPEHIRPLLDAGVRGWVCFECISDAGELSPSLDLVAAVGAADVLIIATDVDDLTAAVGAMAAAGAKVVLIECSRGPLPAALSLCRRQDDQPVMQSASNSAPQHQTASRRCS